MIHESEGSAMNHEGLRGLANLGMHTAGVASGLEPGWLSFNTIQMGLMTEEGKDSPSSISVHHGYLIGINMSNGVPEELRPAIDSFIQALTDYKNKEQDRAGS